MKLAAVMKNMPKKFNKIYTQFNNMKKMMKFNKK